MEIFAYGKHAVPQYDLFLFFYLFIVFLNSFHILWRLKILIW